MDILKISDFFLSKNNAFAIYVEDKQKIDDVHGHEFDELVIIKDGCGFHVVNGEIEFINKGDFFFVTKNDVHSYKATYDFTIINILLNSGETPVFVKNVQDLLLSLHSKKNELDERNALTESELNNVSDLVDFFCRNNEIPEKVYCAMSDAYFLNILAILTHCVKKREDPERSKAQEIIDFLKVNFLSKINWEELCSRVGVTRRTMHRLLKKRTGLTPDKLILVLKTFKAQELLITTDLPIHEIAHQCGFSSAARLSGVYKNILSKTPTQERCN